MNTLRVFLLFFIMHALSPICSNDLLDFYGLSGDEEPTPYSKIVTDMKENLCPNIESSCCTLDDFYAAKTMWEEYVVSLKGFTTKLFNIYQKIASIQKTVSTLYENVGETQRQQAYCKDVDQTFFDSQVTYDQMYYFLGNALETFTFLQKGFYCAICDEKTHRYFTSTPTSKVVTMDSKFCSNLIFFFKEYVAYKTFYMDPLVINLSFLLNCLNKSRDSIFMPKYDSRFSQIKDCALNGNFCSQLCTEFRIGTSPSMFIGDLKAYEDIVKQIEAVLERFDQQQTAMDFPIDSNSYSPHFFTKKKEENQPWDLETFKIEIRDDGLDLFEIASKSNFKLIGSIVAVIETADKAAEKGEKPPETGADEAISQQKVADMEADSKAPSSSEMNSMEASEEEMDAKAQKDLESGNIGNLDAAGQQMFGKVGEASLGEGAWGWLVVLLLLFKF